MQKDLKLVVREEAGTEVEDPALARTGIMNAGMAVAGDGGVGVCVGGGGQGGRANLSLRPEKAR